MTSGAARLTKGGRLLMVAGIVTLVLEQFVAGCADLADSISWGRERLRLPAVSLTAFVFLASFIPITEPSSR